MHTSVCAQYTNPHTKHMKELEQQVSIIFDLVKYGLGLPCGLRYLHLQRPLLLLLLGLLADDLLLLLDLLEAVELLPLPLVQLCGDVVHGGLDLRNDDVLYGVNPAVGDLDDLVEGDEGGLEGR